MPGGLDSDGGGAEKEVIYRGAQSLLPGFLHRYLLAFEAAIESAVSGFAGALPAGARVLDAGAGEARHAGYFSSQRYVALDLAVGDAQWNYSNLDALGDLTSLPFRDACFDACLNIVTLEHVRQPAAVVQELARVLRPGGRLLLAAPQEWEVHQAPHDFYRYTRYGLQYLLDTAGFTAVEVRPVGGYFRLMSRRILNGLQFFPGVWFLPAALLAVPPALLLPLFDCLDARRDFTLGYICSAQKPAA